MDTRPSALRLFTELVAVASERLAGRDVSVTRQGRTTSAHVAACRLEPTPYDPLDHLGAAGRAVTDMAGLSARLLLDLADPLDAGVRLVDGTLRGVRRVAAAGPYDPIGQRVTLVRTGRVALRRVSVSEAGTIGRLDVAVEHLTVGPSRRPLVATLGARSVEIEGRVDRTDLDSWGLEAHLDPRLDLDVTDGRALVRWRRRREVAVELRWWVEDGHRVVVTGHRLVLGRWSVAVPERWNRRSVLDARRLVPGIDELSVDLDGDVVVVGGRLRRWREPVRLSEIEHFVGLLRRGADLVTFARTQPESGRPHT